jgi:endonuclease/exonuclease/phosphatase family metal-dependent hydrolase
VFAKQGLHLEPVPLKTSPLELFLPCRLNASASLLAVWTRQANSPTFGYIGQLWKFLEGHSDFLKAENALLIGDLNSNACWDVWDRWWNHSDVVTRLQDLGLQSIYHLSHDEAQGQESRPTFYMHRKSNRPYHIDYAFLSEALLSGAECEVGDPNSWLEVSDHMPIVLEVPALPAPGRLSPGCRPG